MALHATMERMKFAGLIVATAVVSLLSSCSWVGPLFPSQISQIADNTEDEAEDTAEPVNEDEQDDATLPPLAPELLAQQPEDEPDHAQKHPVRLPIAPTHQPTQEANAQPPAEEQDEPADIRPSEAQMAAAIKMLQQHQTSAPSPQQAAPSTPLVKNKPSQPQQTPRQIAPSPSRSTIARQTPRYTPRQEPEEMPFFQPEQDPARQRGLRSPSLPKLLPMDINGKIHSSGH